MAEEYIEREAAIKEMSHMMRECFPEAIEELDAVITTAKEIPAADVVEVRHGRWIDMGDFISCSLCNATRMKEFLCDYDVARRLDVRTNYCPNCGARMDGGQEPLKGGDDGSEQ